MSKAHGRLQRKAPAPGAAGSPAKAAGPAVAAGPSRARGAGLGSFYAAVPAFGLAAPVQTKLVVGEAGDSFEREADSVADRVVSGSQAPPITPMETESQVSRCPCEEPVQRKEDSKEESKLEPVQKDAAPGAAGAAAVAAPAITPAATRAIRAPGAGAPLSPGTRGALEPRLGADLSGVRVHSDGASHRAAESLHARAFTHGSDVWLGPGESQNDLRLMAHEVTHVVQQDGLVRRQPADDGPGDSGGSGAPAGAPPGGPPAAPAAGPPSSGAEAAPPAPPAIPAGADAELLMPEPPAGLSAEEQARLAEVEGNAAEAAAVTEELPPAEESVGEARGAVAEPQEETAGRAQAGLVAALGERPAPSPEIEQLCDDIHEAIASKRPPDEQSLVRSDPTAVAQSAGAQLNSAVEGDAQRVEGEYDPLETPPEGTPQQQPQPMEPPPASVETPDVNAAAATPEGVPAENVSLDADVAASQARMDEAGMSTEPAQLVQSGPIAEARAAQGELAETAQRDPAEVMAEQQATLSRASADMAALQQRALEALASSRAATVQSTTGQQQAMVGSEEQQRAQISAQAQGIFNAAQTQVTTLLQPLAQTAMSRWDAGVAILSTRFKSRLSEVEGWIRERHAGGWGAVVSVWDDLTGLPGWVIEAYDTAEKDFGDGVCDLIREISIEVNSVVATCEALIAGARTQIDNLFANLPAELQAWAAGEQARLGGELDGLHGRVAEAQTSFNRDLVNRAANSVQEVRQQIHGLREKAKGLLGRVGDALARFAEDPAKFILEGLLELVGIPPAAFWALVARISSVIDSIADDPMNFANNLMAALAQGFQGFFDRIGTHLLQGLMDWLFSGLGSVGVTLPADFSLKSIITFFLQLMGITWPRIRQVLARHIGEENVALLEKAYELIANLIEMGPEGLFKMIEEQLSPQAILDQVLNMAKDYIIETVITQVTARIIALFNPAGAIVQAVEAIYRVLSWVFNNAARIFRLVETVVNGVADLIAGNTAGMARAVEAGLASMISPVIDFLAGYAGVGDLPEKIADGIRGLQDYVMGIIDRVIGWLAERARGLLRSLGLGGDEEGEAGGGDFDGQIGKRVPVTATGGGHTLWIEVRGNSAKLVVQSAKQDLLDFLQGAEVRRAFSDQEGNLTEDHANVVQPAIALATRTELDASGVQALLETATQTADPADDEQVEAKDDEVESEEVQLAGFLSQIFSRLQAGATDHLQLSTRVRRLKEQSYRLFQQLQRTRYRQEIDEIKSLAEEYHDVIDDRSFLQQLKPDIETLEARLNSLVGSLPAEMRQAEEQAQAAAVPPRLAAARQGAALVNQFKDEGIGQEAGRSGGHGEPYKRAGAELVRRANQLPRTDPMHEALKIEGNRLVLRGTAISHRGGW